MNERIKKIRKDKSLTLEQFGARLGVTKTTISRLENGERSVTEQMIKSICREFNINEEWLRTGKGCMPQISGGDKYTEVVARIDKNDPKARKAILEYWDLSDKDKELWWNFVERFLLPNKKRDGTDL